MSKERSRLAQAITGFQQKVQHVFDAVRDGDGSPRFQITQDIGILMIEDAVHELLKQAGEADKLAGMAYLRIAADSAREIHAVLDESPLRVVSIRMQGPREAGAGHVAYVWAKHHGSEAVLRVVEASSVNIRDYIIYD